MKEEFLILAENFKNGKVSEKDLPIEILKLFKVERSDFNQISTHNGTINDFIIFSTAETQSSTCCGWDEQVYFV